MLALTLTEAYQLTHREGKVSLRLKIVHTYNQCGSLRETARWLSISRNTVRKWVRRYRKQGEAGLVDRSRRPHTSPRRTPKEVEEKVLSLSQEQGWGRRRISHALGLPEGTVRHILRLNRSGNPGAVHHLKPSLPEVLQGRVLKKEGLELKLTYHLSILHVVLGEEVGDR